MDDAKKLSPRFFDFLGLPKELRLMVYEYLPVGRRHYKLDLPTWGLYSYVTLVIYENPASILATCRIIYEEMHAILKKEALSEAKGSPRMIIYSDGLDAISRDEGLVQEIFNWISIVRFSSSPHDHARFEGFQLINEAMVQQKMEARRNKDQISLDLSVKDIEAIVKFVNNAGKYYLDNAQLDSAAVDVGIDLSELRKECLDDDLGYRLTECQNQLTEKLEMYGLCSKLHVHHTDFDLGEWFGDELYWIQRPTIGFLQRPLIIPVRFPTRIKWNKDWAEHDSI